jgi:quinol monooxygenase YgiN
MYGLTCRIRVVRGARGKVAHLILGASGSIAGCLSYIVASDPTDPDILWITEVWDDESSHKASLRSSAVQAAIAQAKPIIVGFENRFLTSPIGGIGLRKDERSS